MIFSKCTKNRWELWSSRSWICILINVPVGIYKEAYLKEIFKKYGDEEEAPEPPILPDWCYEVRCGI